MFYHDALPKYYGDIIVIAEFYRGLRFGARLHPHPRDVKYLAVLNNFLSNLWRYHNIDDIRLLRQSL